MKKLEGYIHGVNLGGWLSQCVHTKEHYDTFIGEQDFKTISDWGLDHVRLPVDYNLVETDDGTYKEEGFAYIQSAIDWAKKYHLNVILDLHKTAGFFFHAEAGECGFFTDEKLQERFYRLWEEFTKRYSKYQKMMCFELLNEVTDQSYCAKWNEISTKCIKRIRVLAPEIKILIGSYWNNAVEAVADLAMPVDKNVVYNFHCYEPIIFTHQGAKWVSDKMNLNFRMPLDSTYADYQKYTNENLDFGNGKYDSLDKTKTVDEAFFEKLFEQAIKVAEERDVCLYCGEYGVIDLADTQSVLDWYKLIGSVLEKHNIGRAAWTYKTHHFGIADSWADGIRDNFIKLL